MQVQMQVYFWWRNNGLTWLKAQNDMSPLKWPLVISALEIIQGLHNNSSGAPSIIAIAAYKYTYTMYKKYLLCRTSFCFCTTHVISRHSSISSSINPTKTWCHNKHLKTAAARFFAQLLLQQSECDSQFLGCLRSPHAKFTNPWLVSKISLWMTAQKQPCRQYLPFFPLQTFWLTFNIFW